MLQRRRLASALILAGLVSAAPVFAASGTFTFVTGDVNLQRKDGQRVTATKGTAINPGDAVVTGGAGVAQLTMVDQAKISLRPNTQFQVEQYAESADSDQGALLNLVRGTLRTFTGLIASRNRDRFVMKTKVATVGIRGSGNVLFAGTAADCDPAKVDGGGGGCDITVNHTIEGSHAVTFGDFSAPGLPPQQGGAQSLVTGPGQTVLVTGRGDVKYIPTPQFIADSATNPSGAAKSSGAASQGDSGDTRNFGPGDGGGSTTQQGTTGTTGNTTVQSFPITDTSGNVIGGDPLGLQDVMIASGTTLAGQALQPDIAAEGGNLRSYRMYPALGVPIEPAITGGTARDNRTVTVGSLNFVAGRWENPTAFGYFGPGSGGPVEGSAHWIMAGSGHPAYLSEVLTGTVSYLPVINTSPTNQLNTTGTLTQAQLDVNFSARSLTATMSVSMPAAGGNAGGSWQLLATDIGMSQGFFFASTGDRLRITNGSGQSSAGTDLLSGNLEGSLVGSGLQGAILGYNVLDQTAANPANYNTVTGVVGFQGPAQNISSPYRDGLVSDPQGILGSALVRNFSTSNRPEETVVDAQGRVTAFAAPYEQRYGGHQSYTQGTSSIAQFGTDAETGLVWGRWAGGVALVTAGSTQQPLPLDTHNLHYIFSGIQTGPVTLPLTGEATYSLIGGTSPTDNAGNVGTLNSASLAANFTQRTVDMNVNVTVAGNNVVGSALNVPIIRDQYFTAFRGNVPAGLPIPQLLNISCSPGCPNATGSIDGFFAGRSAQGAGMMYNLNGVTGAAGFRKAGG